MPSEKWQVLYVLGARATERGMWGDCSEELGRDSYFACSAEEFGFLSPKHITWFKKKKMALHFFLKKLTWEVVWRINISKRDWPREAPRGLCTYQEGCHSLSHPFILQVFLEHLLCASQWAGSRELNGSGPIRIGLRICGWGWVAGEGKWWHTANF